MSFQKIVETERLIDPRNPTIILCNQALTSLFNLKSFNVNSFRNVLKAHISEIPQPEDSLSAYVNFDGHFQIINHILDQTDRSRFHPILGVVSLKFSAQQYYLCAVPENINEYKLHINPPWAEGFTSSIPTGSFRKTKAAKYVPQPKLLVLIRSVLKEPELRTEYTILEIRKAVLTHLLLNHENIFDNRSLRAR